MWRDDAYLLDMLTAARKVLQYTEGIGRLQFDSNEILQHAVMRQLEIIGEAARCISAEAKEEHQQIPWQGMIGLRNRLIHEYFRIRIDRVWETIECDIPALVKLVEPIVQDKMG